MSALLLRHSKLWLSCPNLKQSVIIGHMNESRGLSTVFKMSVCSDPKKKDQQQKCLSTYVQKRRDCSVYRKELIRNFHLSSLSFYSIVQQCDTGRSKLSLKHLKNPAEMQFHMTKRNSSEKKFGQHVSSNGGFSFLSFQSLLSTPFPFMAYGLGGLIPFAAAPGYMWYFSVYDPSLAWAQLMYGACILSFLGGVSWGSVLEKPQQSLQSLAYSIFLPLIGWSSVLVHPNPLGFVVLMSGVAFAGFTDTQFAAYPNWFKNLRFLLSSVVVICLFFTFTFRFVKEPVQSRGKKEESEQNA